MFRRALDWVGNRAGLEGAQDFLKHKTVPVHSGTIWYYLGGVTLFLFVIQVLTGMLLLLYYRPTPTEAFESVQFIVTQVEFGWLIRSVHSWAANLMVLTALLHMFSVFFLKAYRKPRELTWLSGMALLLLTFAFGFSGYLLPWNTLAYFATKVGTDMAGAVPVVGRFLRHFLRGGEEVTGATLTRFFGFHVAVLPGLTTLLLLLHLALVQKWGISSPKRPGGSGPAMPFYPNFVLRELIGWYGALGVLGMLAALFPWELGTKADPFASAPAGIRPEWYFLAVFFTLKLIPGKVLIFNGEALGILVFGLAAVGWMLVPFWDNRSEDEKRHLALTGGGVFVIAYLAVFSALGYWR